MIGIIKYNGGNSTSVMNALDRIGAKYFLSNKMEELEKADRIIFPGVGEASSAINYLKEQQLDVFIKELKIPFLGICLGLQVMCNTSEEGDTNCLSIFNVEVKKFQGNLPIPHMGWNSISSENSLLTKGINDQMNFYFVHSYYACIGTNTSGVSRYINEFSSIMEKDNFFGVQFHPEKSAKNGEIILKNFIAL